MTPELNQGLRQAAIALNNGQPDQAVAVCEELLKTYPGQADCRHLLGVALISAGQVESGSALLDELQQARPGDVELVYNHASALLGQGLAEGALKRFDQVLAIHPEHLPALNNRGNALLQLGQRDEARKAYGELLKLDPEHARGWFNLGNLELAEGRVEAARDAYAQALRRQPAYPQALLALGHVQLQLGQCAAALAALEKACELNAADHEVWRLKGQALAGLNRFEEARAAAARATELAPDSAEAWNSLGSQLTAMGQLEESERALRKALALDPDLAVAWTNLAALLELANRVDECAATLEQALERWPGDAGLVLTQARLLQRKKDHAQALAVLEALDLREAPVQQQRDGHFLLGQVHDRLGRYEQAFSHYEQGNQLAAYDWRRGAPEADGLFPAMGKLAETFTAEFVDGWPEALDVAQAPAFLLSFQRSGTTLLDTMLGAHPGVQVMEEQPALNAVLAEIKDYPAALRSVPEATLQRWRDAYWSAAQRLSGFEVGGGQLLLDKSPLHTVHLGLIQRLFPGAPIIFALRHPLDVVLSCFMQDFTLSAFMLRYTSLSGVSEVYRRVMDLWQQYRRLLPLNVFEIRYESLVTSAEPELKSLVSFLGLPWDPVVLDNVGQAQNRGLINTPSYHQVSQPLYASSSNRWRNYASALAPVRLELEPYCELFGYDCAGSAEPD